MTITDDIVKSLRNPTPLYAVAGTADLAAEKLREMPALFVRIREQAPGRFEKLRGTDPRAVQERMAGQAKGAQKKLGDAFADVDFKELRDVRKLGESVQGIALQGVGRATEVAVRARETYDGLAERGKGAVATWRGEAADEIVEIAAAVEPRQADADGAADEPTGGKASTAKSGTAKSSTAKPAAARKPAARRKPSAKGDAAE